MLRVHSFNIADYKEVNALLATYPLAKGMHILVSDGHVMIPFEDGDPEPLSVRIATIKEQINDLAAKKEIIVQSQMVLEALLETKRGHFNELKANIAEADTKPNAKGKAQVLKEMRAVEAQASKAIFEEENRVLLNKKEIERMDINIAMLNKRIEEIGDEKA